MLRGFGNWGRFCIVVGLSWLGTGAPETIAGVGSGDTKLAEVLVTEGRPEDDILACSLCHADGGQGDINFAFGNLTGHPADYVAKQLKAFQQGERSNRVMQRISKKLTETDIESLAAYYSNLKVSTPAYSVSKVPEVGLKLAKEGDESRGLPPCESCHGPEAEDAGRVIGNIRGQHSTYIVNQLMAWQLGERSDGSAMADIAPLLSISEINAVAIYFASQSR